MLPTRPTVHPDTVTPDSIRGLFRTAPTRVSVVTAAGADGRAFGMTCNAVVSVSLDPPILLVCLHRRSRTRAAVVAAGTFAVNFLAEGAVDVANRFAGSAPDKFVGLRIAPAPDEVNAPLLADGVVGWIACRVGQLVEAGDHTVVLGHATHARSFDLPALVYHRHTYSGWTGR
jgi:flavin reductase (DIM6/NTAB) family NADH-FMN oxidoreductase RutF